LSATKEKRVTVKASVFPTPVKSTKLAVSLCCCVRVCVCMCVCLPHVSYAFMPPSLCCFFSMGTGKESSSRRCDISSRSAGVDVCHREEGGEGRHRCIRAVEGHAV
jgi:hypothetical protein